MNDAISVTRNQNLCADGGSAEHCHAFQLAMITDMHTQNDVHVEVADFITVLTSLGPALTKRWLADGTIEAHGRARWHSVETFPVSSIHDVARVMDSLRPRPQSCMIRGELSPSWSEVVDPERKGNLVRRSMEYFRDRASHVQSFDVDKWVPKTCNPDADPVGAIREWIAATLPPEFLEISFVWALSSSAGHSSKAGSLNAHIHFYISRAMTSAESHAWATMNQINVDRAFFQPVQAHFVADPLFDLGVVDPIAVRAGFSQGMDDDVVEMQIDEGALAVAVMEGRKSGHAGSGDGGTCLDPRLKPGLIGAWCRVFTPEDVLMADWFKGNFERVSDRRLTWLDGGGAKEGAYLTDDGHRLVNVHDTSPCDTIGKGLNSWDIVRVYNFGHLDDAVPESDRWAWSADAAARPSEAAMRAFAMSLPEVRAELEKGDNIPFDRVAGQPSYSRTDLATMIDATEDFEELTVEITKLVAASNLRESEREILYKAIAKKAKVPVATLKKDATSFQLSVPGGNFEHLATARRVINAIGEDNLIYAQESFWGWRGDGVWRKWDDREVKQKVHDIAPSNQLTANVVGSILDMVKTEVLRPNQRFDESTETINCLNGELCLVQGEWQLRPHEREHFRTTMIPVAYDPGADAPRFRQFLEEIFEGDPDADNKMQIVLEALGYTLIPSCRLEKFIMLIGSGANGKSVLLATLNALLGREHVCAVQPSQFENRFQRAHLQGRLANIITEIAEGAEIHDAQLKSLVSGEMTTAEHKHKPPFDFFPFAKHWFGTNHLPHTRDFSDALFRRAIVITFNNKFEGDRRDVHLADKLQAEMPGILNLALAGLKQLVENKAFTECASSTEIKRKWRNEADQAAQFVEDVCDTGPGFRSTSNDLFSSYRTWAAIAGINRTLNRNNFTTRLARLGFEPCRGAGGTRMLEGISLRPGGAMGSGEDFMPVH